MCQWDTPIRTTRISLVPLTAAAHRRRPGAEGKPAVITLSENFRALFYAPFYATFAIGAFRAEGVEVTLRDSPSPAQTAADLRAGRIDVMWGGPLRVLLTHQEDPESDIVCFCDVVARDPFFIIGRTPVGRGVPTAPTNPPEPPPSFHPRKSFFPPAKQPISNHTHAHPLAANHPPRPPSKNPCSPQLPACHSISPPA